MKLYLSQVNQLLELVQIGKIKAILLYGPDKGYINKICKALVKKFSMVQTSMEYTNLNVASLEMLLNSRNFFGQKELVKIRSVTNSIDKNLKIMLNGDYFHLPVFIGDEIASSSSIKKFFETEQQLAAIACYHDDEQKIEKLILNELNKAAKTIKREALIYLKTHLRGDHGLICNEITKLVNFAFDKQEITLEDVKAVISSEIMANGNDLAIYFAKKDYEKFLHELAILKKQNINEVLIIRALIRYYLNLYIVLSKVANGEKLDLAIKSLSPPIFYQYINDFKQTANQINLHGCLNTLAKLQQAEVDFKLRPASFDLYQQICNS
ncbi:DNA polymerase III subunit delta [Rickettsia endosymbiont of Halotydeus destructor]|uniref:DNA polymerase III subunit delta n=1 Tax=Rickettsia endosymbiont of Halotydeus destructor TaxID=2996754 RepID=UPI003BAF53B8